MNFEEHFVDFEILVFNPTIRNYTKVIDATLSRKSICNTSNLSDSLFPNTFLLLMRELEDDISGKASRSTTSNWQAHGFWRHFGSSDLGFSQTIVSITAHWVHLMEYAATGHLNNKFIPFGPAARADSIKDRWQQVKSRWEMIDEILRSSQRHRYRTMIPSISDESEGSSECYTATARKVDEIGFERLKGLLTLMGEGMFSPLDWMLLNIMLHIETNKCLC